MSEILSERIPLEVEGTPVSNIMITEPFTCTENCTISDVVRMLAVNEVSSMPVVDEGGKVVGFISDGDIMGAIAQHRAHDGGREAEVCANRDVNLTNEQHEGHSNCDERVDDGRVEARGDVGRIEEHRVHRANDDEQRDEEDQARELARLEKLLDLLHRLHPFPHIVA